MSTVHDNLRYPIGPYEPPTVFTDEILSRWIAILDDFPARLTQETAHLTDEQLDTRYRPKGWTIRQVVHHCADSHFNSFVRFKLALTEEKPVIKPYFEDRWAELVDGESTPIEPSLKIIEGIHERWVISPEKPGGRRLAQNICTSGTWQGNPPERESRPLCLALQSSPGTYHNTQGIKGVGIRKTYQIVS
jgi:hypothetical protein